VGGGEERLVDDRNPCRLGRSFHHLESRGKEGARTPEDAQIAWQDPISEQNYAQRPVVLAGDPDQAIRVASIRTRD
jgi:hypothetical protein